MSVFSDACQNMYLPEMALYRQHFPRPQIHDVYTWALEQLRQCCPEDRITEGQRIAITAGSRGISKIQTILRAVVNFCYERNAVPFLVPAMGSHGGATAEGQAEILCDYGITEETMGCPILSDMKTEVIGHIPDGRSVHMDSYAAEADGIIVVNRIKPHTAFRGLYESGLMKMIVIGLGKQIGAESIHASGFGTMAELLPLYANTAISTGKITLGLAILENAYDETAELHAMKGEDIPVLEPGLLRRAKELMPRILFDETDVLIVDKIGKNYSGDGHDPNITGRFLTPYADGGIRAQRMVVLDLSYETHGNGCGLGLADITTRRAWSKLDYEKMNANILTNTVLAGASVPPFADSDHDAIAVAIRSCNGIDRLAPKIIRISNTSSLEYITISNALIPAAENNEFLEQIHGPEPFLFDASGNLTDLD